MSIPEDAIADNLRFFKSVSLSVLSNSSFLIAKEEDGISKSLSIPPDFYCLCKSFYCSFLSFFSWFYNFLAFSGSFSISRGAGVSVRGTLNDLFFLSSHLTEGGLATAIDMPLGRLAAFALTPAFVMIIVFPSPFGIPVGRKSLLLLPTVLVGGIELSCRVVDFSTTSGYETYFASSVCKTLLYLWRTEILSSIYDRLFSKSFWLSNHSSTKKYDICLSTLYNSLTKERFWISFKVSFIYSLSRICSTSNLYLFISSRNALNLMYCSSSFCFIYRRNFIFSATRGRNATWGSLSLKFGFQCNLFYFAIQFLIKLIWFQLWLKNFSAYIKFLSFY